MELFLNLQIDEGGGQPEALVLVSADSSIDTSKVSLKLTKLNGIKKIYEITGQYDICVISSGAHHKRDQCMH